MSQNRNKALYFEAPIRSLRALCELLRLEEPALRELAAEANGLYRPVKPKSGSKRETFDALPRLKLIHAKLKTDIFERVIFPDYLTGSLKGRDYKKNAEKHAGKKVVVCEDVKSFFPSIKADKVYDVWNGFFGFAPDVSSLLTALTTKDGAVPQGAIPSSYLANLVLWRSEPLLHAKLASQGIDYSRYVDDISFSSVRFLSRVEKTAAIGAIFGMLSAAGLRAGREKHQIFNGALPMIVTKLVVNNKPSLTKRNRAQVRAAMFQLLKMVAAQGSATIETIRALDKMAQRVGQLGRFHPQDASLYRQQLQAARAAIEVKGMPTFTSAAALRANEWTTNPEADIRLPWD